MSPPSHMTIELGEKDVRDDLPKIINGMSQMRTEALRDRKLTDEQKDEYLHMAYRLASGMQAITDGTMIKRMQVVAERLNKNPTLLQYDPMQDEHWKKNELEFAESLDDLLITLVRDDFHNVDAKHHVLQAVKYLGTEDSPSTERERVYDTILPFNTPSFETKESMFKKIFGRFFGNEYKLDNLEGLVLNVDATKDGFSPELIDLARERGYTTLRLKVTDKESERMKKYEAEIMEKSQIVDSESVRSTNEKAIKIADQLIKYTKLISYPLLGALPKRLQDKLDDILPEFDKRTAFASSCWAEVGLSLIGSVGLATVQGSGIYVLTGIPTLLDGIMRGMDGVDKDGNYDHSVSSVFLKPIFYPVEKILGGGRKPERNMTIEMPVRKIKSAEQLPNPVDYYDGIAKLKVPEDVEQNLAWHTKNHHNYGKAFLSYVRKNTGEKPGEIQVLENVSKENQSVSYNHELIIDGLRKNCSLYCFNGGRRYLVTAIGNNNGTGGFVEKTGLILASAEDAGTKLRKIGEKTGMRYVHLREYRNGKVLSDMEASS